MGPVEISGHCLALFNPVKLAQRIRDRFGADYRRIALLFLLEKASHRLNSADAAAIGTISTFKRGSLRNFVLISEQDY